MKDELLLRHTRLSIRNRLCLSIAFSLFLLWIGTPLYAANIPFFIPANYAPTLLAACLLLVAAFDGHSSSKLTIDRNVLLFFCFSILLTATCLHLSPLPYLLTSASTVYGFFALLSTSAEYEYTNRLVPHAISSHVPATVYAAKEETSPKITCIHPCDTGNTIILAIVDRCYTGGIDGIFADDEIGVSPITLTKKKNRRKTALPSRCVPSVVQTVAPVARETAPPSAPEAKDAFRPFRIMLVEHDYTGNIDGIFPEGEQGVFPFTLKRRAPAAYPAALPAKAATVVAGKDLVELSRIHTARKPIPEYASDVTQPLLVMLVDRNYTGGIDGIFSDDDKNVSPLTIGAQAGNRTKKTRTRKQKLHFTVISRDDAENESYSRREPNPQGFSRQKSPYTSEKFARNYTAIPLQKGKRYQA